MSEAITSISHFLTRRNAATSGRLLTGAKSGYHYSSPQSPEKNPLIDEDEASATTPRLSISSKYEGEEDEIETRIKSKNAMRLVPRITTVKRPESMKSSFIEEFESSPPTTTSSSEQQHHTTTSSTSTTTSSSSSSGSPQQQQHTPVPTATKEMLHLVNCPTWHTVTRIFESEESNLNRSVLVPKLDMASITAQKSARSPIIARISGNSTKNEADDFVEMTKEVTLDVPPVPTAVEEAAAAAAASLQIPTISQPQDISVSESRVHINRKLVDDTREVERLRTSAHMTARDPRELQQVGHKVAVEFLSVELAGLGSLVEPLFCNVALFNAATGEKMTENFYFQLNNDPFLPNFNAEVMKVIGKQQHQQQQHLHPQQQQQQQQQQTKPKTVFHIEKGNKDLYLVLIVEKILSDATVDTVAKNYENPKAMNVQKMLAKSKQLCESHISEFRQKIFFGYIPLYEVVQQDSMPEEEEETPEMGQLTTARAGKSPRGMRLSLPPEAPQAGGHHQGRSGYHRVSKSDKATSAKNIFGTPPRSASVGGGGGGVGGPGGRRVSGLFSNMLLPPDTTHASTTTTSTTVSSPSSAGGSGRRLSMRASALTPPMQRTAIRDKTQSDISVRKSVQLFLQNIFRHTSVPTLNFLQHEEVKLLSGEVTFKKLYKVPPMKEFDVYDIIMNQKKFMKPVADISVKVKITDASNDDTIETTASPVVHFNILFKPWTQVNFIHNLFIYPLQVSGLKHPTQKARNIVIKILLRDNDRYDAGQEIDSLACIYPEFAPRSNVKDHLLNYRYSSVTYHDRNPQFIDEFKLQLPIKIDKHHLLFIFYHAKCTEKAITDKSTLKVLGYAFLNSSMLLSNQRHSLPVTPALANNYLTEHMDSSSGGSSSSASSSSLSSSGKAVFSLYTRLVSNFHVADYTLQQFIKQCEYIVDNGYRSLDLNSMIQKALTISRTLQLDQTNFGFEQNFSYLANTLFKCIAVVYHLKLLGTVQIPLSKQFLQEITRVLLVLMRSIVTRQEMLGTLNGASPDNDILRAYIEYVFSGYVVVNSLNDCQPQVVTLHEALLYTFRIFIMEKDNTNLVELWYFVFEIIFKSIALYISDGNHCRSAQDVSKHLKEITPSMKRFVTEVAEKLCQYYLRLNLSQLAQASAVSACCKDFSKFLTLLIDVFPDRTINNLFHAFFQQFLTNPKEKLLELLIDSIRVGIIREKTLFRLNITSDPKYLFSNTILRILTLSFQQYPSLRKKAVHLLGTHLNNFDYDQRYNEDAKLRQHVANLYFSFFEMLGSIPDPLIGLDRDGIRNCLLSMMYIIDNVAKSTFKQWISGRKSILTLVNLLISCEKVAESERVELAVLRLLNVTLIRCLYNNPTALEEQEVFFKISKLITKILKQSPSKEIAKYLPIIIGTFQVAFSNRFMVDETSEEWANICGNLLSFVENTHYHQLLSMFLHLQDEKSKANIKQLIRHLYTEKEEYAENFLFLYPIFVSSAYLSTSLLLKLEDAPEKAISILSLWAKLRPDDFSEDVSLCERIHYSLTEFMQETREETFSMTDEDKVDEYLNLVDKAQDLCSKISKLVGSASEVGAKSQVPPTPKVLIRLRSERLEKLINLYRTSNLHKEALKVIVYQLKDDNKALQYCVDNPRGDMDDLSGRSGGTTASQPAATPLSILQQVLQDGSLSKRKSLPETAALKETDNTFLQLLDICLSPAKHNLPNEEPNAALANKIVEQYKDELNGEEVLRTLQVEKIDVRLFKTIFKSNVNTYSVTKQLGKGAQGSVMLAKNKKTGQYVAIKMVNFNDDESVIAFLREVQSMQLIRNPNVVQYIDFTLHEQVEEFGGLEMTHLSGFLVMELCEGDLLKTMEKTKSSGSPMKEEDIVNILRQVVSGLEIMHRNNLLHRDLKPQNILIGTDKKYKIADFGLARSVSTDTKTQSRVGTVYYMSPEAYNSKQYGTSADIWSVGCILYELLTLEVGKTDLKLPIQLDQNFLPKITDDLLAKKYSAKLVYILENCLRIEPTNRLTAKQILVILNLHDAEVHELLKQSRLFQKKKNEKKKQSQTSANALNSQKKKTTAAATATMTPSLKSVGSFGAEGSSTNNIYRDTALFNQDNLHLFHLEADSLTHSSNSSASPTLPPSETPGSPALNMQSNRKRFVDELGAIPIIERQRTDQLLDYLVTCESSIVDEAPSEDTGAAATTSSSSSNASSSSSTAVKPGPPTPTEIVPRSPALSSCFSQITSFLPPQANTTTLPKILSYQRHLFITARYFTNPDELLDGLIAQTKSFDESTRISSLKCIESWINHGNLCYESNTTISKVIDFCSLYYRQPDLFNPKEVTIIKQMRNQLGRNLTRADLKNIRGTRAPDVATPKEGTLIVSVLDYPEIEIARQMTLIDSKTFKQIKPYEWTRLGLDSHSRYSHSPNVYKMITNFNKISRWVSSEIVRLIDTHARVQVIKKFINVAKHLFELNNLNSLKAIIFGLNYSAVTRMKKTWNLFIKEFPDHSKLFEKYSQFCESNESVARQLKHVEGEESCCVPFIGTYLSLIKTIEIEHTNFIECYRKSTIHGGNEIIEIINTEKFRKISVVIQEIQALQRKFYSLKKYGELKQRLEAITNMVASSFVNNRGRAASTSLPAAADLQLHAPQELPGMVSMLISSVPAAAGVIAEKTNEIIFDDKSLYAQSLLVEGTAEEDD